ncbi:helix-turn-helix domain-containing protein [Devosia sp.]|uniref:MarR family transcriptional regulator n=1 Tax=Devosia sp. TaxID=1871048 RepID=UPI001AC4EDD7|nr:helix-turn-helix domain-containing protein [Devosia sp.]MBN9334915.1 MarR family transcriptional regulator [Devosia sp.]
MVKSKAKEKEPRHVRLYHWLLDTEAWLDLGPVPQAVYVRLVKRYGGPGSNNGMIPCSLLDLAQECRISKQTAMRALDALQDHGFIVRTTVGAFNMKHRHATEWLLTEFKDDRPGKGLSLPSKDFARWRKSEHGSTSKPERVSTRNRAGFQMEQSPKVTMAYGSTSKPVGENDGSTSKPLLVYQGEGPSTPAGTAQDATEEAPPQQGARPPEERTSGGPSTNALGKPVVTSSLMETRVMRDLARPRPNRELPGSGFVSESLKAKYSSEVQK